MPDKLKYEKLVIDDGNYKTILTDKYKKRAPYQPYQAGVITAFIPGTVREILVKEGDTVVEGQILLILEAMKMRNKLIAPFNGVVKKIIAIEGEIVPKNQTLVVVE
jgi:biotin carboxyl carrier protein